MSNQASDAPHVVATIGGRRVARSQVLRWEACRALKVMERLDIRGAPTALTAQRAVITERKMQFGHQRIEALLDSQLRVSGFGIRALARLSSRRRALSTVELAVGTGSAATFVDWWNEHVVNSHEAPLLAVCPDHWIIRPGPNGWQEVVETTGGSPMASRLFIDHHDTDSLRTPADPLYPHQITAVARLQNGTPIGGLRHQLRDTADGFDVKLTAELPAVMLPTLVAGHRWHLACEFSNMIEAAAA